MKRVDPTIALAQLPHLGIGLGYRAELDSSIRAHKSVIDCLEIISEHYLDAPPERMARLRALAEEFPILPHGIEMSIGTVGDLDPAYVDSLAQLADTVKAPWVSDHLSYTRAGGIALGQLTPLMRSREMAAEIAAKAQYVQDRVGVPFLLENITYYVNIAAELSEAQFIAEIMERCTCGLLLDVTNVLINSTNHRYDPIVFLDSIPLERVVQIHLAGGEDSEETVLDMHSAAVPAEVWELLRYVIPRAKQLRAITLERDQDFPDDFGEIAADLEQAHQILLVGSA